MMLFKAVADNIEYTPDVSYTTNWNDISLLNNNVSSGSLAFEIPTGTTISSISYNGVTDTSQNYNVIYVNNGEFTAVTPEIPNAVTLIFITLILVAGLFAAFIYKKAKTAFN